MLINIIRISLSIISLIITIVIYKEYKCVVIHNKNLKADYEKAIKERDDYFEFLELYKKEFEKNKKIIEKTKEMENILKAIIYKFANNEMEISEDDIKKANETDLYMEDSYMKFAKRLKVLSQRNYLKTETE